MLQTEKRHTFCFAVLGIAIGLPAVQGAVIYVDPQSTGTPRDGTEWSKAFHFLRDALAAAETGDEIWVAGGFYRPTEKSCTSASDCPAVQGDFDDNSCSTGLCVWNRPRAQSFRLPDGVAVYGGFLGCETSLAHRRLGRAESVLSGDLNGDDEGEPCTVHSDCTSHGRYCVIDDIPTSGDGTCILRNHIDDNSYHVVLVESSVQSTRIDGFTITGGNASVVPSVGETGGGGIRIESSAAGVLIWNSKIVRNASPIGFAGGGGGLFSTSQLNARIVFCVIAENFADHGGGIASKGTDSFVISNSSIVNNVAHENGGGVHLSGSGSADVSIVNSIIARNVTTLGSGGAGVFMSGSVGMNFAFKNSNIAFNHVIGSNPGPGGGLWMSGVTVILENCIIWGNSAGDGKQIYRTSGNGGINVRWSIVERLDRDGMNGDDIAGVVRFDPTSSTLPQPVCPTDTSWANLGCESSDEPLFTNINGPDGLPGTYADNDYSLLTQSPGIDAGNNELMPIDDADVDDDANVSEKSPFEVKRLNRRLDDPNTTDTGEVDTSEDPVVEEIIDMGAHEGPRCLVVSIACNDFDWCTADTCTDNVCANECVERCYGNVNHSSPTQVNLDDVLAVMNCFGGGCANCGPNGTGTVTGCDIAISGGCPTPAAPTV